MEKTALIMGGGRGIGKHIAVGLAEEGYRITAASRTKEELEETKNIIESGGGSVRTRVVDIKNSESVNDLFDFHKKEFGHLNLAVNAAAIQGAIGLSWEVDPLLWTETVAIDLIGSYYFARSSIRSMKESGGSIVLFSGGGAAYARPMFCAYGVAKTGVVRLVEVLFLELQSAGCPHITINAIAPGAVKSKMTEEVLKAGQTAGNKALEEAKQTFDEGGTSPDKALKLVLFLSNPQLNGGISGRLLHVNEPYEEYGKNACAINASQAGLLRRMAYPVK